jgi:transcriptional regulator with XRE-family HTH domain
LDENRITEKIRLLRRNKNITLKALSEKMGITEGYLSRIENSDTAPPISTLSRIAQALEVDISYLLSSNNKSVDENPSIVIVKNREENGGLDHKIQRNNIHGYQFEPLASKKKGKNMQPYILIPDFNPGEFLQHEGEEFLYVLEGDIEFLYGTEKYQLSERDCAYFDSNIPHNGRSLGERRARVLIILYPYKRY